ncbi:GCN5-related N-acetyltransferase [Lachnospiraceae bacterium KM106-2]|nr:GCN5-related N-acetyltransferase [Lachnospiraceae bacterium KM106-2]
MSEVKIEKLTKETTPGKAKVLYDGWHTTYKGIVSESYLNDLDYEECLRKSYQHPENTYVALVDGQVVGFVSYCVSRDFDIPTAGEVKAIYLLKEYQHKGIGRKLMEFALAKLAQNHNQVILWVAAKNESAIRFYESFGFEPEGKKMTVLLGGAVDLIRLQKRR